MTLCPNCNQEMREGTAFCPHCGFRLVIPKDAGKLLTGSPIGDVILGIVLHLLLLSAFNGIGLSVLRNSDGLTFLLSPILSGILYFVVAWRMKYRSLGAGIWWTYVIGIFAVVAIFVIILGVCLIGGMGARHWAHVTDL